MLLTQPPPKMSDDDADINTDYNDGYEHGYNDGFLDGYHSDANGPDDDEQNSEYLTDGSESESEAESVQGSSESETESEAESDRKYKYKYKYKYKSCSCSKCVNDSGSETDDPGYEEGYEEISRPVLSRPNQ